MFLQYVFNVNMLLTANILTQQHIIKYIFGKENHYIPTFSKNTINTKLSILADKQSAQASLMAAQLRRRDFAGQGDVSNLQKKPTGFEADTWIALGFCNV